MSHSSYHCRLHSRSSQVIAFQIECSQWWKSPYQFFPFILNALQINVSVNLATMLEILTGNFMLLNSRDISHIQSYFDNWILRWSFYPCIWHILMLHDYIIFLEKWVDWFMYIYRFTCKGRWTHMTILKGSVFLKYLHLFNIRFQFCKYPYIDRKQLE